MAPLSNLDCASQRFKLLIIYQHLKNSTIRLNLVFFVTGKKRKNLMEFFVLNNLFMKSKRE